MLIYKKDICFTNKNQLWIQHAKNYDAEDCLSVSKLGH